jgi:hypothetical protein
MADLFTLDELDDHTQSTIAVDVATLARTRATAVIENYCRTTFTGTSTATEVLRVKDGFVRLPRRPVNSITSVKVIGTDGTAGAAITGWAFDGIDRVDVRGWSRTIINLAADLADGVTDTVQVVWVYGYATVPADVKAVALEVAGMQVANPQGLRQETVGGYSVTYAGGNDVFGLALTDGQKSVLDEYRIKRTSMRTGTAWH